MKCIILAGGFATRLWPLTENKAKPLLHVRHQPLISHIVDGLPADVEIIVSTNAVFEGAFNEWKKSFNDRKIIVFVEDSTSEEGKRGALGATAHVIETLGIEEDLLLIAGDNYFGFKMADFIGVFKGNPLLAAFDIKSTALAKKFGVVIASEGKVTGFQEKPAEPKSTLVSTGCYLFPARNLPDIQFFSRMKKDDLGGVFEFLLGKAEVIDVFRFEEAWHDIGSFEAYLKANLDLLDGHIVEHDGVKKEGRNTLLGGVFLGENTRIRDCVLENCVVLNDCTLENCVIRNCVIDEGCVLKNIDLSLQMLRRGSRIEK